MGYEPSIDTIDNIRLARIAFHMSQIALDSDEVDDALLELNPLFQQYLPLVFSLDAETQRLAMIEALVMAAVLRLPLRLPDPLSGLVDTMKTTGFIDEQDEPGFLAMKGMCFINALLLTCKAQEQISTPFNQACSTRLQGYLNEVLAYTDAGPFGMSYSADMLVVQVEEA